MANRVFQNVVYQMKDAVDRVVGVIDETGTVISCSELGQIGDCLLYTSDAADERSSVDLGVRRINKKKNKQHSSRLLLRYNITPPLHTAH